MKKMKPFSRTYGIKALMTFEEVAKELKITPQRVYQIERIAMRKLAERLIAKGYRPNDVDTV